MNRDERNSGGERRKEWTTELIWICGKTLSFSTVALLRFLHFKPIKIKNRRQARMITMLLLFFFFFFGRVESDVFAINWVMFRGVLVYCREAILWLGKVLSFDSNVVVVVVVVVFLFFFCRVESDVFVINWVKF